MIVLGPMDADLNGAPSYWREGNWRPRNLTHTDTPNQPSSGSIRTVPFDKCRMVHEYDARFSTLPLPSDQGWTPAPASPTQWVHEAGQGTLKFDFTSGQTGVWSKESTSGQLTANPLFVVAYSRFMVEQSTTVLITGGLDFLVVGTRSGGAYAGMRALWDTRFHYVTLSTSSKDVDTSEPIDELLGVWHRMALDANLDGSSDNAKTIGSLDDAPNYDPRDFFGTLTGPGFSALKGRFGKENSTGVLKGRIRNFVTSAPGRFIRAWFRAAAPATGVQIRLILTADVAAAAGNGVFKIRYGSPSLGTQPYEVPANVTIDRSLQWTSTPTSNFNKVRELAFPLTHTFVAAEPLWFTVERVWDSTSDTLDSTVHLLQVIVEKKP